MWSRILSASDNRPPSENSLATFSSSSSGTGTFGIAGLSGHGEEAEADRSSSTVRRLPVVKGGGWRKPILASL